LQTAGYAASRQRCKLIEQGSGWVKTAVLLRQSRCVGLPKWINALCWRRKPKSRAGPKWSRLRGCKCS